MDGSKAKTGKTQDEPGTSSFGRKYGNDQRMIEIHQKGVGASLKRPLLPTMEQFEY